MSTRIEVQTILDECGVPVYAIVPMAEYQTLVARSRIGRMVKKATIPHEVVSRMVDGASAARAWREHLGLTQMQVAKRMNISQAALAQTEKAISPRPATRARLAAALGIRIEQLVVR